MCYNWHVSLASGMAGYVASLYLVLRKNSARDMWHGLFLFVFITIQWLEFFVWHYGQPEAPGCTALNAFFTRVAIPLVLALEPVCALAGGMVASIRQRHTRTRTGVRDNSMRNMLWMLLVYIPGAVAVFVLQNATADCSRITKMGYLHWGFYSDNLWFALAFAAATIAPFLLFMRPVVVPLVSAAYTLFAFFVSWFFTDALGTNWCLFSIFLIAFYILDPWLVGTEPSPSQSINARVRPMFLLVGALVLVALAFYIAHLPPGPFPK